MSRFGLSLGFGYMTVKEVCLLNNVDCHTFLAVVSFIDKGCVALDFSSEKLSVALSKNIS